jgi:hypothetical protein
MCLRAQLRIQSLSKYINLFDTTLGVKHKMESETQSENRYTLDIVHHAFGIVSTS